MEVNVCLIQTFQYLCQFKFNMRYKFGKLNIIPNVLSSLSNINSSCSIDDTSDYNKLDVLNEYHTILVEISKTFAEKILEGYNNDKV